MMKLLTKNRPTALDVTFWESEKGNVVFTWTGKELCLFLFRGRVQLSAGSITERSLPRVDTLPPVYVQVQRFRFFARSFPRSTAAK